MPKTTLVVKIDKSLHQGKSPIDAVVGNWIISPSKANKITTVVAVAKQRVVGVFDVSNPSIISSGCDKGRVRFGSITELPKSAQEAFVKMEPFGFRAACRYI